MKIITSIAAALVLIAGCGGSSDGDSGPDKAPHTQSAKAKKAEQKAAEKKAIKEQQAEQKATEEKAAAKKDAEQQYLYSLDETADKGTFTYAEADRDGLLISMGHDACKRVGNLPTVTYKAVQNDVDKYAKVNGLTEYQASSIYGAAVNTLCSDIGDQLN